MGVIWVANIVKDMEKIESPFVRKLNEKGDYVVIDEIAEGYEWVFEDDSVMAIEKLHGTNVSVVIENGQIVAVFNRTERIPFFNKGKRYIIDAVQESWSRGYMENLLDGQWFGEVIGPKLQGNPYGIKTHVWIPFATFAQKHLKYKSWGKYPKDFATISKWFQEELIPLYALMQGNGDVVKDAAGKVLKYEGFVEGIVFTHPDGRMAKLRVDMFDWYSGSRHKDTEGIIK
jgi:hypothetical protein